MGAGIKVVAIALAVALTSGVAYFVFLRDSDGDAVPDLQDAFPRDATETSDFDHDGTGDHADPDDDNDSLPDGWETDNGLNPRDPSDASQDTDQDLLPNAGEYAKRANPRNPDTDGDVVRDGTDVDPAVDVVVAFQYIQFRVEDPIDVGSQGDIYFMISMGDGPSLTSRVIYFDTNAAQIPADFTTIFNAPDDTPTVHFRTTWLDKDLLFDDELDGSGVGNAVDVDYTLASHTWTGDDGGDGIVSGNDDGSTAYDEDDITLWFRIFDSVGHPDEIASVLAAMGSASGTQDFSQAVRALGHMILDTLVQWALAHPDFFAEFGGWGQLLAAGLAILAVVVKFYRLYFLQNDDR